MREIEGTRRGEVLRGDDRDEDILGRGGPDRLLGRGGDDELRGGRGRDTLDGGPGDDELTGGGGRDRYVWGAGHDEIHWRPEDRHIVVGAEVGLADFSALRSLARAADDGDDVLIEVSDDHSLRLEDTSLSAISADMFRFKVADAAAVRRRRDDDEGRDVEGTNRDERLFGGRRDDDLDGAGGDDVIRGRRGDDELDGGEGADTIRGGAGRDDIDGEDGDDVLDGGAGRDDIDGGSGDDVFVVSRGRDVIGDFDEDGDDLLRLDAALTGFDTAREAFEALRFRDDDAVLRHDAGRVVLEDVDRSDIDLGDFDVV